MARKVIIVQSDQWADYAYEQGTVVFRPLSDRKWLSPMGRPRHSVMPRHCDRRAGALPDDKERSRLPICLAHWVHFMLKHATELVAPDTE